MESFINELQSSEKGKKVCVTKGVHYLRCCCGCMVPVFKLKFRMPRMKKQRYVCLPHTGVLELWCVFLHPQAALIVDGKVGLVSSLFVTAKEILSVPSDLGVCPPPTDFTAVSQPRPCLQVCYLLQVGDRRSSSFCCRV